jgi:tetratricopeptide (TPR) repeat protein
LQEKKFNNLSHIIIENSNNEELLRSLKVVIFNDLEKNNLPEVKKNLNKLILAYQRINPDNIDLIDLFFEEILELQRSYFEKLKEKLSEVEYNAELKIFENSLLNEIVNNETYNHLLFDYGEKLLETEKRSKAGFYFNNLINRVKGKEPKLEISAKIGDLYLNKNFKAEAIEYYNKSLGYCDEEDLLNDKLVFLEILIELYIETGNYKSSKKLMEVLLETAKKHNLENETTIALIKKAKINYLDSGVTQSDFIDELVSKRKDNLYYYIISQHSQRLEVLLAEINNLAIDIGQFNPDNYEQNFQTTKSELVLKILDTCKDIYQLDNEMYYVHALSSEEDSLSTLFIKSRLYKDVTDYQKSIELVNEIFNLSFPKSTNPDLMPFLKFYSAGLLEFINKRDNALILYTEAIEKGKKQKDKSIYEFTLVIYKLKLWLKNEEKEKINETFDQIILLIAENEIIDEEFIFGDLLTEVKSLINF